MTLWLILIFAPAAFGATEWWSRALLEALIFGLAALCALRADLDSPPTVPLLCFGLLALIGVAQVSHVRSLTAPASWAPFAPSRAQAAYSLAFWLALGALLWSVGGILRWEGALRRLCRAVFGVGVALSIVGIIQLGQGNTAYYGLRPVRFGTPFGPFANCDHAATWLVASAFCGAGLFVSVWRRGASMPLPDRIAKQSVMAFALAVVVAGVLASRSRGALNALIVAAGVTAFLVSGMLGPRVARVSARFGLAAAAIGYAVFLFKQPRWLGIVDGALDVSTARRVAMYRGGLAMLADFPLFGIGMGGFQNAFHAYRDPMFVDLVEHVHSSWLEIMLELGAVGGVVFAAAVLAPAASFARRLWRAGDSRVALVAGCFAGLLAFIVQGVVEFSFQIGADAALFVVLLAVVASGSSDAPSPNAPRAGGRGRTALAGAFVALAAASLPPGFVGARLRLGAPFQSPFDGLLTERAPDSMSADELFARLRQDPVDPRLRYRYGVSLWKAGRFADAQEFFYDTGVTR